MEDLTGLTKSTQVLSALASGLMATTVGSSIALTSSLIPQVVKEGIAPDFQTASWLATGYLYTAIPASLLGGFFSDYFGRRRACLIMCLPLLAGWVMIAMSPNFAWLLMGRVLTAIASWGCYPGANVLISESVHPSVRGYLGVFPSILLAVGMFKAYLLGYLLAWRTMCWILCSQPILLAIAILAIKESPYWLVQQGRTEEAKAALQWYRGEKYDVTKEFREIVKKKEDDMAQTKKSGLRQKLDTIFSLGFMKCLSLTGGLFFVCQFTGITSLVVFMTSLFKESGSSLDPFLGPVIVGAVRVATACCSSLLLRAGNRLHIFCCCSLALSCLGLLLGCFSHWQTQITDINQNLGLLPLLFIVLMFVAHALGINSVLHLLTAEVFPTNVRSMGSSLTLSLAMIGNAANASLYPVIQRQIGFSGVFWIYSGCSLALAIYAYLVIPDHRGLSLVTIEREREASAESKKLVKS